MTFTAEKISKIYNSRVANRYDFSMPHFFKTWKKRAVERSALGPGFRVLVFCCGTGLDFAPILGRIGEQGTIVGVDFSEKMLDGARRRIAAEGWQNVSLVHADITEPMDAFKETFDAGVCTLGLSIIPDFHAAYENLLADVKPGGQIIVGDMQLASGALRVFNPLTLWMSKRYGGTRQGHENSKALRAVMAKDLSDTLHETFFFGAYYFWVGTKRSAESRDAVTI